MGSNQHLVSGSCPEQPVPGDHHLCFHTPVNLEPEESVSATGGQKRSLFGPREDSVSDSRKRMMEQTADSRLLIPFSHEVTVSHHGKSQGTSWKALSARRSYTSETTRTEARTFPRKADTPQKAHCRGSILDAAGRLPRGVPGNRGRPGPPARGGGRRMRSLLPGH